MFSHPLVETFICNTAIFHITLIIGSGTKVNVKKTTFLFQHIQTQSVEMINHHTWKALREKLSKLPI